MYKYFRPLLFKLDPETAHSLVLKIARLAGMIPGLRSAFRSYFQPPAIPVEAFGLKFKNPIGLAAGYDKDGIGWRGLSLLGFSHIELGTVTPRPQAGNPRPRIFRLIEDEAIINRMGFPGLGADAMQDNLSGERPDDLILGVNIGMNKDTPLESASNDYLSLLHRFASLADYLTINISSPNTEGLRRLQAHQRLDQLLAKMVIARQDEEKKFNKKIPLLVKLSPDLTEAELDDVVEVISSYGIDGLVATNTSIRREEVKSDKYIEEGGLSGRPLGEPSTEIVRKIQARTSGNIPVIGSGGIMDAEGAKAKLDAGAVLIQVYSGLIYKGPGLVKEILRALPD